MKIFMPIPGTHSREIQTLRRPYPAVLTKPIKVEVALAHHWLVRMRGGENVLELFSTRLPSAPIYILVAKKEKLGVGWQKHFLHSYPIGWVPNADRFQKCYGKHAAAIHPPVYLNDYA